MFSGYSCFKVGSLTLTHCIDEYNGYCGTIAQPLDRSGASTLAP